MQKHDAKLPILIDVAEFDKSQLPDIVCSKDQVRRIDNILIQEYGIPGLTLMRRAAEASVVAIRKHWPDAKSIRVYCGSGNNAADGYIVAGLLMEQQLKVEVVVVGDAKKLSSDGQRAYQYCLDSGADLVSAATSQFIPNVIVDAMLGTGFHGEMREAYACCIDEMNACSAPILAIDVPSGLLVDKGVAPERAVYADVTVTFIALKLGLLTGTGIDHAGQLYFAPLVNEALSQDAIETAKHSTIDAESGDVLDAPIQLLKLDVLRSKLPTRPKDSHKYRFGHVLVIGGDLGMGGAPLMSALAAMRCGAGMVTLATHPGHAAGMNQQHPELMVQGIDIESDLEPLLAKASVIALGPGLGRSEWSNRIAAWAFKSELPMVVDADGLNTLAVAPQHRDNWVLTPHPGEAGRLLDSKQIQNDRLKSAVDLQNQYGGVVALKGAGTLIAMRTSGTHVEHTDKDISSEVTKQGCALSLCPYGNPGMSTAGMGDVLCGVIAGLIAEFGDIEYAAELGVVLHSAAADQCVTEQGMRGLMATDLIPMVRRLLNAV